MHSLFMSLCLISIGSANRVCDASSDPISIAVSHEYPNKRADISPTDNGMANVASPYVIDLWPVRLNCCISISSPAKNMTMSLPTSARNFIVEPSGEISSNPLGPRIIPPMINPTNPGRRKRSNIRGRNKMMIITSMNVVSGSMGSIGSGSFIVLLLLNLVGIKSILFFCVLRIAEMRI